MTTLLLRYLTYWHGRGEAHQAEYYRCHGCRRLVTWHALRRGGCGCGLSNKLSPAALRRAEKVRLVLLPFLGVVR